ncbi:MAG TPA: NAD-dependent epimerase/dehydratase family protein [Jatrophihabitantaceae bacterium]|nr:NAD-dependent epimerase/dehydratase family protein [Jatrophihabitantaceae bacterium]
MAICACQGELVRIVVTGGAGFIGRHVVQLLRDTGHDVLVVDSAEPLRAAPDRMVADVRARDRMDVALRGADAVCHLAAKVGLGVDTADLPDYADRNVRGTAVLLAAMANAGVARLVLASSMVVYGEGLATCREHGTAAPPPRLEADLRAGAFEPRCRHCRSPLEPALVPEQTPLDPRNGYAASKAAQEYFAASWARETAGRAVALRYHNVYGPGMPRNTPYAGVAAIFASALRDGLAPRVFEDGGQRRDFIHVRDVAAATVAALDVERGGFVALNVGSGTPRTVGDLATAAADVIGGPVPQITGEFRLGDVRHITADSSRARRELDWCPQVDFRTGVAELVR